MTESAEQKAKNNNMQWFDLSSKGIFLTPEIICGKPCVLLLDSPLIYSESITRKIILEDFGFEPILFESRKQSKQYLYIKFTESLDSDFLVESFDIPLESIQIINKPLIEIQTLFYKLASECYSFRVDVLLKSSLLLGINHQGAKVYSSMFGRYKVGKAGKDKAEKIFDIEMPHELNLAYLRAKGPVDVLACCEGFVCDALGKRRNVSLADAMRFAAILFQDKNTPLSPEAVKPQQLLMLLNAISLTYIKYIVPGTLDEIKRDLYFSNRDNFKSICLNSEACPSPPRAIYTDFMANQYSTPTPISFIMQRLLIGDYGVNLGDSVLDPMYGFGSLTNILSKKGMPILGVEKSSKTAELVGHIKFDNTRIEVGDSLSGSLLRFSKDGSPFKYVICNPACYITPVTHEYKSNGTSIRVRRSDFHILLKSLIARSDGGRTVFLLPYFTEEVEGITENQHSDINELLSFIHARYNIEGVTSISNEIYSKSLKKISPLLVVIGDKRKNISAAQQNLLEVALQNPILNYESLWDWASMVCYKRSELFKVDEDLFQIASETQTETLEEIPSAPATTSAPLPKPYTGNNTDQDDDLNFDSPSSGAKNAPVKLEVSNVLFSNNPSAPKMEIPSHEDLLAAKSIEKPTDEANLTEHHKAPAAENSEPATENTESTKVVVEEEPAAENTDTATENTESTEAVVEEAPAAENSDTAIVPENADLFTRKGLPSSADGQIEDDDHEDDKPEDDKPEDDKPEDDKPKENKPEDDKPAKAAAPTTPTSGKINIRKEKIAKNKGNLFSLNEVNKVIRYHSTATLSEPTANVHQSEFGAYLTAKQNLNTLISKSFTGFTGSSGNSFNTLVQYKKAHNLSICVETYVGALLGLGHPKTWCSIFKSEHLDLIASAILKFEKNRSLAVLDSMGLRSELVVAALLEFNRQNKKASFIVIRNPVYLDRVMIEYKKLHQALFSNRPELEFVTLGETEETARHLKEFNPNIVNVVLVDVKQKPLNITLKGMNEKYLQHPVVFHETDFGAVKQINPFFNMLYQSPGLYISSRFIGPETNIKTIQGLFPANVTARYFGKGVADLDDMSSYLLKIKMIEDLSLFQRFEDLSFIDLSKNEDLNNWSDRFSILSKSYSSAINNVVLLAEEIHKHADSKANNLLPNLRGIAMQIYELCTLCITAIPLTHSIFQAVRNQSKPIVVMPKTIENILFLLLETLSVKLIKGDNKIIANTLTELNQYIDQKKRLIENDGGLNNSQDSHFENIRDLETHIAVRNQSIFDYLTHSKHGGASKIPDLTSLIAAFYRNSAAGMHESMEKYSELKLLADRVEDEINTLMDLPLLISDFIKYELGQHQITSGEITERTLAISFKGNGWSVEKASPCFTLLNSENSKFKVASEFNSGSLDVLFIEADLIDGLQLSSIRDNTSIISDHNRKRVLILTYLNKPIQHYLPLIHLVSDPSQFSPPEVYCELLLTPVQKVYYQLFVKQLELFNVRTELTFTPYSHISYYLSDIGQKLIGEYLQINPSYLAYKPNVPINFWDIYDVLNIVNMTNVGMETNVLDHLNYLARQHLDYLKDINANPFDIFSVSPKAKISHGEISKDALYLNQRLDPNTDDGYFGEIKQSTLTYVKNAGAALTIEQCSALHQSQKTVEIAALKSILINQFADNNLSQQENFSHADWVAQYIEHYTNYLVSVYRDKVIGKLHDRYRKWIFAPPGRVSSKTHVESHFRHQQTLRVSSNLDDLYFEILMLADMDLIEGFESACKVLSFLKTYHLTVSKQNDSGSPILLPVPSPFNDMHNKISEGLLIRVDFPPSVMISLSAKAFSLSIAYPSKSKPIELNLAYVLEHHRVLDGRSILSPISDIRQKTILKAYNSSGFKDLITQKIRDFEPEKISEFSDIASLNQPDHHPTVMHFRKKHKPLKLRNMYVIHGNLFDAYYFLRRLIPLTMVSFTNENGLAVPGFVVSPNMNMEDVSPYLIRVTQLQNVAKVLKFIEQQQSRKYLTSIQWNGDAGILDVSRLNETDVELNFIGKPSQLQKVFTTKQIFKEYPNTRTAAEVDPLDLIKSKVEIASEQATSEQNVGSAIGISAAVGVQAKPTKKGKAKASENQFIPFEEIAESADSIYNIPVETTVKTAKKITPFSLLSLEGVESTQKGEQLSYRFKVPYEQLHALVLIIEQQAIYSIALIDYSKESGRSSLTNLVQKN